MSRDQYDHRDPTQFSLAECQSKVGLQATLELTGVILDAEEGPNGPFVRFLVDERFGFGDAKFGIDLDALDVSELPW